MKSEEDTSELRTEKKKGSQKTNVIDKENRQNYKSNNAPCTVRFGDVSVKGKQGIVTPDTHGLRDSRTTSPLRATSQNTGIGEKPCTSSCEIFRATTSSQQQVATKELRQQPIKMVTPQKTDLSKADSESIDEALADLDISYYEGDSNDSSFDSCDVYEAVGDAKYVHCLEHKKICRIDNPLAEILLNVDKTPTSGLPTPNTSPMHSATKQNDDCVSINLLRELQSSLKDDDSHITIPTQNQLREMSDSLSDVMNVSEIASLKRPIPISPSDVAHVTTSKKSSSSNKNYSTPASCPHDNNSNRKLYSC